MKIKVLKGGYMPRRAHFDDAGLDLLCPEHVEIAAHGSAVIDLRVYLENHSDKNYSFELGEKVVQLIIQQCLLVEPEEVDELDESISGRGAGGFGSTGK